ncbi:hypothetical protein [Methylogaea oryzae]|uniref:hypothetical protein n=1 Tax=Methylogaea oryzae TaxID=1295382 RepID=UPI0012E24D01|nr:hypothetical protein [Methylogaea oryzae]
MLKRKLQLGLLAATFAAAGSAVQAGPSEGAGKPGGSSHPPVSERCKERKRR